MMDRDQIIADEALAHVEAHAGARDSARVLAAEVRKLRARRTVLARQSPVVRRLARWANSEHADTDVAADVRALLKSYDALLGRSERKGSS